MDKKIIENIKNLVKNHSIRWTNHAVIRLLQRNIMQSDVEDAIMSGEIIEEYADDYPYPSYLIFGKTTDNNVLHVVCGVNNKELYIITAYKPDPKEWNDDLKTRRESK